MNKKKVILTGDRPTGPLHIGHYVGSLKNRVEMQQEYEQFILIADVQALTDNYDNPEKVRKNIVEVAMDYMAVGINPNISTILIQSMIPEIAELTVFYLNLVSVARLQRNPTVKDEIKAKGFGSRIPAGFLMYPVSQAADITAFKANTVPVGIDQVPVIEQTVEIVRSFNRIYNTNVLVEPKAVLSSASKLPGIDGSGKMSKSLGNAIYLSDSADVIKQKIMSMYTDPDHIHVEDPGKIEGNVVFTYLDAFDPDKKTVSEMKIHYRQGGLGDVKVKKRLVEVMEELLLPIRTYRAELAKDKVEVMNIVKKGTEKAREVAAQTMSEVKKAMKIDYFG